MDFNKRGYLAVERTAPGVHVVRFASPHLRELLYDDVKITDLWREFQVGVLAELGEGETLVLNLAPVGPFPSPFYRCLLNVGKVVQALNARLVLCGLGPEFLENLRTLHGLQLFEVVETEEQAVAGGEREAG